ncbi:MAG: alpha/beta fold hydrolase [Burkholderiaceae bacterium]|nr:alpha/beta fold hydrolase [Burkholderiaceae bacterium]
MSSARPEGEQVAAGAVLPHETVDGGTGPYMFLVHGMLSSRRNWDPNLERLRRRVRPVVFDLWGHGGAPAPEDPSAYEVGALVAALERARESLGAGRIMLCGQSFGGGLVLRYAIEHPEHTLGVIVTNSVSALAPPDLFGSPAERRARAMSIAAGGREAIEALPFHPRRARRIPEHIRIPMSETASNTDPMAVARLTDVAGGALSVREDLHRIQAPVLITNGVLERAFQPLCNDAAQWIPGCRVVDIEAGHAVNLENAAAFDDAVDAFLAEIV